MSKFVFAAALAMAPFVAFADHPSPTPTSYAPQTDVACSTAAGLTVGSRGAAVSCLQQHLIEEGYLPLGAPTGYFGMLTKNAVSAWQRSIGVPSTGYFGTLSHAAWSGVSAAAVPHAEAVADHHATSLDTASWPAVPSVAIALHKDAMSGYNLEITPTNFRFAPEHVNGAVVPNEGHAHLYIDGKKIARVYGTWMHLSGDFFPSGSHEVRVTLNANDHSDLSVASTLIEARATIITQ